MARGTFPTRRHDTKSIITNCRYCLQRRASPDQWRLVRILQHIRICQLEHCCDPMHVLHLHLRPIVNVRQFRSSHVRLLCRHTSNVRSAVFWMRAPKDFDIPALGLVQGDRLEPSQNLQDVADWDDVDQVEFPVTITFWRRGAETRERRRLPIMDPELGFTLDSICLDTLHCLFLGPAKDWCAAVLWAMIDHNVFHVAPRLEDKIVITVRRVKERLWAFYKKWKRDNPGDELTELQDLIPTMLGTDAHRNLAVKAMETKCLLPFCQHLLEEFAPALPSELADCSAGIGTCMARYLHLLRTELMVVRPETLQDMYDTIARMLRLWKITGLHVNPKLHLLMHLVHRTEHLGNPAWSTRA